MEMAGAPLTITSSAPLAVHSLPTPTTLGSAAPKDPLQREGCFCPKTVTPVNWKFRLLPGHSGTSPPTVPLNQQAEKGGTVLAGD